jgi:hypothetical protein
MRIPDYVREPWAGSLLVVSNVGVRGKCANRFKGRMIDIDTDTNSPRSPIVTNSQPIRVTDIPIDHANSTHTFF